MIDLETVTKIYTPKNPPAVDSLDLSIKDGEILGLVGLNGAGKTTSIRMTSGIILPTSGKIMVDGYDIVTDKVKAAANVGWIPELPNFEPNATPLQLMNYFAGFYNMKGKEAQERIMSLLEQVGLKDHLHKKLRSYSQGMKKRFSIAESIIGDPQNVMFDETLNGLDPEGVLFVRNLMMTLKKRGKAILLSSHILSEIQDVADRVAIIDHGKLLKIIRRSEMKTLGKTVVHVTIENFNANCKKILSKYGDVETAGNESMIRDLKIPDVDLPSIPEELVKSGYRIVRFDPVGESLEQYFFGLIGGVK
ncbi:MAG: ABC transporter ATP-binding protein [Thermoplasmataceae archaeon]|jgi:ABC-2 type transport system ATP-binding protein|nr:ABC transporter ATP-binding protein [Candidatus Thermoplasmatota archaeon]